MDRSGSERAEAAASGVPVTGAPVLEAPAVVDGVDAPLLDGVPRQRRGSFAEGVRECERVASPRATRPMPIRPWRLLPTPTATPFTFGYAAVLVVTSLVAEYASPSLVHALHQASSTDVAHLVQTPVLVLIASALWIAGGMFSPYAIGFLLVLTALERRIGGARTAGVFLLGHVIATLATEVPVGLAVLAGQLPDSSLHRLDYGVSFGVAASVGALAGLLTPWLRWPLLITFGATLVADLIAFTDPMTNWGHVMSLAIGVAAWPLVRRRRRDRGRSSGWARPQSPPSPTTAE
ncbi:rhomboid-like protein [Streptomyces sp. NBC_00620]|uniref:rhomboid-like protein n=1 Tax=Streptomyces sp. NBC_00620 TaxID=2903666 RepID=UPI002B1D654E|nr:rhomboid-like protein [Streptomyces sp. NBC_00620]